MLFNSYIFVFLFFPLCLSGYYGLLHVKKAQAAKIFLTIMSLWFYGYFNLSYLLIMVGSIVFNYIFHLLLSKNPDKKLLLLAVAGDLGILFYFKYFDFSCLPSMGCFNLRLPCLGFCCLLESASLPSADFLCGGHLPRRGKGLQTTGLCPVCVLFPAVDCRPYRQP